MANVEIKMQELYHQGAWKLAQQGRSAADGDCICCVWHWRKGHFKAAAKQKWLYGAVLFFQDTAAFPPLPIITTEDTDYLRLTGTDRMMTLIKFQQKVSARKY